MKKILTALMAAALLFMLVPVSALAAGMEITASLPTFVEGKPETFTIGTVANDDEDRMVRVHFTLPAGATIEYQEGGVGDWIPLTDVFGPPSGFPLDDITTTFRGTFAQSGSYTVRVEFIEVGTGTVLGGRNITATVVDPLEITSSLPTFTAGRPATFTVGTRVNDTEYLGDLVRARFTLPAGATVEYQEGGAGPWIPLTDVFGPSTGFPLGNITTTFRGTFARPGSYTVRVEFIEVNNDNLVLASRDITATVVEPTIGHTVSYHPNGGTGTVPVDMNRYYSGDKVTLASGAGLTKPGAVFLGWALADGKTVTSPYTMGSSDVTFFAVWGSDSDLPKIPKTGDNVSLAGFVMIALAAVAAAAVILKKRASAK